MFRILVAGALAVVVGAMLDWIGVFWDASQSAYEQLYGKPMAHPRGDTLDHVNDWLAFLPSDPATRAGIVAGVIIGLLTVTFVANVIGIRLAKGRREQRLRAEARARTISSYNKVR